MAKKTTAHRPSQSHLEYVTTQDGRTVKNTAYSPSRKNKSTSVTPVSGVLPQKTRRDYYNEWKTGHPNTFYSFDDMEAMLTSTHRGNRSIAVSNGYHLDILKNDKDQAIRAQVAKRGYALDELKNDPGSHVRAEVARQGYALDELKDDRDRNVREEVARQGYALDKLKNDKYWVVRQVVAEQGYALDELKDDHNWRVRQVVAKQGYALDELKDDHNWRVRKAVAEHGYALDELKNDEQQGVRYAVACQPGSHLYDMIHDDDAEICEIAQQTLNKS